MKLFITVGVLVALLGITEAAVSAVQAVHDCSARYPDVTREDMDTYYGGIYSDGKAVTDGNDVASYATCLLIETGVLSLDGSVDVSALLAEWLAGQTEEVLSKVNEAGEKCSDAYSAASDNTSDDASELFNILSDLTPIFHACLIDADFDIMNEVTSSQYPESSDE